MGLMDIPGIGPYLAARRATMDEDAQRMGVLSNIVGVQGALQQQAYMNELKPLEIAQRNLALQNARQGLELRRGILGGMGGTGPQPGAQDAMNAVAAGGGQAGPTVEAASRIPQGALSMGGSGALNVSGLPPMVQAALLSGDAGLEKWAGAQSKFFEPRTVAEGGGVWIPGQGFVGVRPKVGEGLQATGYGPTGELLGVQGIPGYNEAQAGIVRAQEGARAGLDLVSVPVMDSSGRSTGTRQMSRLDAIRMLQVGQPAPAAPASATPTPAGFPRVSPEEQASRDAQARRLIAAEDQPGGGGLIPSPVVLGAPSEAQQAAERERAVAGAKREGEAPQAGLQAGSQLDMFDRLTSMANQVLKAPGLDRAVGLYGAIPNVPGGKGADAESLIDSLRAQVSAMKLQAMRDASKTGGAVGNVTEKEWPRLESMIAALNPKASPELFRQQVGDLIKEITVSKTRIQDAYTQEFGKTPGAVAPRSRQEILNHYLNPNGR